MNKRLSDVQISELKNSPFEASKGQIDNFKLQKEFRKSTPEILSNILSKKRHRDTLILIESYPNVCSNCRATDMLIWTRDSIYRYYEEIESSNQIQKKMDIIDLSDTQLTNELRLELSPIIEAIEIVRNKKQFYKDPLDYGANLCFDGEHTMISVIYPNEEIKSRYFRCWLEPENRELLKKRN